MPFLSRRDSGDWRISKPHEILKCGNADWLCLYSHRFTKRLDFAKPNDRRAIDLMNAAAREVVRQFVDIVVAYGQSDEFRSAYALLPLGQ